MPARAADFTTDTATVVSLQGFSDALTRMRLGCLCPQARREEHGSRAACKPTGIISNSDRHPRPPPAISSGGTSGCLRMARSSDAGRVRTHPPSAPSAAPPPPPPSRPSFALLCPPLPSFAASPPRPGSPPPALATLVRGGPRPGIPFAGPFPRGGAWQRRQLGRGLSGQAALVAWRSGPSCCGRGRWLKLARAGPSGTREGGGVRGARRAARHGWACRGPSGPRPTLCAARWVRFRTGRPRGL
jgi:hypothetical protein